jgi:hypothetical protein
MPRRLFTIALTQAIALTLSQPVLATKVKTYSDGSVYVCATEQKWKLYATAYDAAWDQNPIAYLAPEECLQLDYRPNKDNQEPTRYGGTFPVIGESGKILWLWGTANDWYLFAIADRHKKQRLTTVLTTSR